MKPISLNRARKAKSRTEAKAQADANAVKHGRTKAERLAEATREARAASRLDQLKFEDDG